MRKSLFVLSVAAVALAACSSSDAASRTATLTADASGGQAMDSAKAAALIERADRARIQGDTNAIWLIEISDFQCPFCKMWHDSTYPAIKREYIAKGFVRMAYVNYPITSHENAVPAAEAAMCAAAQDKFWPMHDALFTSQDRWAHLPNPGPYLDTLAASVRVDMSAWRDCVAKRVMRRLIEADRDRGRASGAGSTPYFFVGREVIQGAAPLDTFRVVINRVRKSAAVARP